MFIPIVAPAAAEWPRWAGPLNNWHVPAGVHVPSSLPAAPRVVWSVNAGYGSGSAVVSGGAVYYLDHRDGKEVAVCASLANGRETWSVPLDDALGDSGSPPGPRGTPTVDGDRVYVLSCHGEFRCLRTRNGEQVWRTNFVRDFGAMPVQESGDIPGAARHGNTASPLIDGNRMYVAVGGRPGASVVCFNKLTGSVIWKSQDDVPGHAGPVMAVIAKERQLVCFTADAVIGLNPSDGRLLWRAAVRTSLGRHITTPVVVDDTIVVGSYTAGLIGIRVSRSSAGLEATQAWRDASLGVNMSSPVAIGGHVYGLGPGGRLFCVEARTGKRAWVEEGFFSGMLDAGFASFMVAGQNLLILAERGQLMLAAVSPAGCKVLGRANVCGRTWCSPAYVAGKLIVRDDKQLRCVQIAP
jgi:outer membrane protein assembly factor BamB